MHRFEYKLVRSRRRTVCLSIKNGELIVRSPILIPVLFINRFVQSKSNWIEKHLKKSTIVFKRQYKEGEKFLYLGRELKLKTIKTNLKTPEIKIDGDHLIVITYDTSKKFIKLQIEKFYKEQSRRAITKYLEKYVSQFRFSGKLTFRSYKSKWGSCSAQDDLCFNTKLVMAPGDVIEYVVLHELAHTNQKNHSKRFWLLVGSIDEKYGEKRKWLRQNSDKLAL